MNCIEPHNYLQSPANRFLSRLPLARHRRHAILFPFFCINPSATRQQIYKEQCLRFKAQREITPLIRNPPLNLPFFDLRRRRMSSVLISQLFFVFFVPTAHPLPFCDVFIFFIFAEIILFLPHQLQAFDSLPLVAS